jgi:NAD(P)-dependent dehydrogenase (short-subunit alcohol dehydrogenase family)
MGEEVQEERDGFGFERKPLPGSGDGKAAGVDREVVDEVSKGHWAAYVLLYGGFRGAVPSGFRYEVIEGGMNGAVVPSAPMRIVLITGCSTGIGLATARHLASRGDRVYATARNPEAAARLVEARDAVANIRTLALDVTDDASVQAAARTVLDAEGRIDVLVNNAGIGAFGTFEFVDEAVARATFETNFWGVMRVTRAVLPAMRAQRSGVIVNVSSVAGRVAGPAMGVYPASKFALEAASEALAREVYSFGIRVAIIEPGFVVTPILDKGLDTLTLDPASPYADVERRVYGMFMNAKVTGASPSRPRG